MTLGRLPAGCRSALASPRRGVGGMGSSRRSDVADANGRASAPAMTSRMLVTRPLPVFRRRMITLGQRILHVHQSKRSPRPCCSPPLRREGKESQRGGCSTEVCAIGRNRPRVCCQFVQTWDSSDLRRAGLRTGYCSALTTFTRERQPERSENKLHGFSTDRGIIFAFRSVRTCRTANL